MINMSKSYRPEIDSLRAIAVLLVVVYHAFPGFIPGGYLGVDIFFVISGFLITSQITEQIEAKTFSFADFYLRRFRRLFPALILVVTVTTVLAFLFFYQSEFKQYCLHLSGVGSFSSNIIYLFEDGYFDASAIQKPLLHLWSLAVEEQFYLVWPFTLIIISRFKWNRSLVTASLLGLSLVGFAWVSRNNSTLAFYLPFTRIWELLAGALLTLALKSHTALSSIRWGVYLRALSIAVILLTSTISVPASGLGFLLNFFTVVATVVLLVPEESCPIVAFFAGNNLLKSIGKISYPLYLWHWPVLSLTTVISFSYLELSHTVILMLLCFLLSFLTYRFVENPLRFHSRATFVGYGLFIMLIMMSGIGFVSYQFNLFENRIAAFEHENKTKIDNLSDFDSYEEKTIGCETRDKQISELPPDISNTYCRKSKTDDLDAIVLGDSHAEHFYAGIAELDRTRNWGILGKAGCPPLKGVMAYWQGDKNDECYRLNNYSFSHVVQNKSIMIVVLAFISPFYVAKEGFAFSQRHQLSPENFTIEMKVIG